MNQTKRESILDKKWIMHTLYIHVHCKCMYRGTQPIEGQNLYYLITSGFPFKMIYFSKTEKEPNSRG